MGEVAESGRTVLFVSHNMGAIRKLCSRTILLKDGNVIKNSETDETINYYLKSSEEVTDSIIKLPRENSNPLGSGLYLKILNSCQEPQTIFKIGENWYIDFSFRIFKEISHVIAGVGIITIDSIPIASYHSKPQDLSPGIYHVKFHFNIPLTANALQFVVGLTTYEKNFYYHQNIGFIEISDISINEQPFRTRGTGLLLTEQIATIEKLSECNNFF